MKPSCPIFIYHVSYEAVEAAQEYATATRHVACVYRNGNSYCVGTRYAVNKKDYEFEDDMGEPLDTHLVTHLVYPNGEVTDLRVFKDEPPKERFLTCQDCGKNDESVYYNTCPYAEEINNTMVDIVICPDCYYERCQDI